MKLSVAPLTFISRGKVTESFPWKDIFKRGISSNVWCFFIASLIISNISVGEWGLKEVFCQRKYIKDEKTGNRGNIHFDERTFMLLMDVSPRVVFSLPSLMFCEILRPSGISQISVGRRAALRATTSQGKHMTGMLSSFRKLSLSL